MVHAILLCCAMLSDGGKPAETTATDRAAYQAAQAKAGNNAAAHVQLALWCEAHGMAAERTKHLSLAVSLDQSNSLARGLQGLMSFQGKWAKPDQAEQGIQSDQKFQTVFREYLDRRIRTPQNKVDAQMRLAAWCLENGLNDEAIAHFHAVTRLDPSRDIAWIRQGYKKYKDRWWKPDDLAARKLESDRQKRADLEWKPRLEKLRKGLESPTESRRLKAEGEVYRITDPRAVPSIMKTLASGTEKTQLVAVELLDQIDGPAASFCLTILALDKPSNEVRKNAIRSLTHRDPRDVIGWLITLIHRPYKYEVRPDGGPGTTDVLMVDGERFDIRRIYRFPGIEVGTVPIQPSINEIADAIMPTLAPAHSDHGSQPTASLISMAVKNYGLAEQVYASTVMEEVWNRATVVQQTLDSDVGLVREVNAQIDETNGRVLPLMAELTGQNFGAEPQAWRSWWADQLGLVSDDRYAEKPTVTDFVSVPDFVPHHACFAAGTLVQTISGPRKIESIKVGDRVLSQSTSNGALSFQAVLATHKNGPAKTLRITIDGETTVATSIHRFWKAGKGWTMARELKVGDRLRVIGGIVSIQSIEPGATQMVYNLDIAENRNFLVGNAGLLVHDFSFVQPVSDPFDRQTNLAPAKPK